MHDPALYPEAWRKKAYREQKIAEAGNTCQHCGAPERSQALNKKGKPYTVFLSIAHKFQYRTWDSKADTLVLCQVCHLEFDKEHHRLKERFHTPIGYAQVYIVQGKKRYLAGMPITYAKLRAIIDAQETGTTFEVLLRSNLAVVGVGRYQKTDEGIVVLREKGACSGLSLAFPTHLVRRGAFILTPDQIVTK